MESLSLNFKAGGGGPGSTPAQAGVGVNGRAVLESAPFVVPGGVRSGTAGDPIPTESISMNFSSRARAGLVGSIPVESGEVATVPPRVAAGARGFGAGDPVPMESISFNFARRQQLTSTAAPAAQKAVIDFGGTSADCFEAPRRK